MGMRACRYRVTGRVQGVGFRAFTARAAAGLGIVGWCRNTDDGSVEGEAFGEAAALQAFLGKLRQGPISARVHDLTVERMDGADAPDTSAFLIRR